MFEVQKSGLGSTTWKTVCTKDNYPDALKVYEKQLELYSVGKFRIIDAEKKVICEKQASFSYN